MPQKEQPIAGQRGSGIPHAVDVHVGKRLRARRLFLGINQESLAKSARLTFQQIQKYEGGANRVSGSRLAQFADALGVDVDYFFEGLPAKEETQMERAARELLYEPGAIEIARLYTLLPTEFQSHFLGMANAIARIGGAP